MAKIKDSLTKFSGKMDDKILVHSARYGSYAKNASKGRSKKQLEVLHKNNKLNKPINNIASDINLLLKTEAHYMHSSDFYERLLGVRKLYKTKNRYVLLKGINEMEVNPRHPMQALGRYNISTAVEECNVIVKLEVVDHPSISYYQSYECNCHYFQFFLLCWQGGEKGTWLKKKTDWISNNSKSKKFTIPLPFPENTEHWLLMIRHIGGENNNALETVKAEAMGFVEAGSFVKGDAELYEKFFKERKAKENIIGRTQVDDDCETVKADEE